MPRPPPPAIDKTISGQNEARRGIVRDTYHNDKTRCLHLEHYHLHQKSLAWHRVQV